jgi:hypothetical protein
MYRIDLSRSFAQRQWRVLLQEGSWEKEFFLLAEVNNLFFVRSDIKKRSIFLQGDSFLREKILVFLV